MQNECLLDLFPVEILHILFTYLCTHEVLLSLTGISDYIDGILEDYSMWRFDFRSIRKDYFDSICRRIQPEKVISLTLSDENDTPGQSELFFSRFQIEQFTRLQSLTLVKIEVESIKNIFSNLSKLEQLRSLSFESDSIISKYPPSCDGIFQGRHRQWYSIVLDSYRQILPNLTRLRLSHVYNLIDIPLLQLRYLKLTRCSHDELRQVIQSAPHLQSLSVGLELDQPNLKITIASSQLTRLRLTIQSEYLHVSMKQMEQFLPNLPHLKHLELILRGTTDLIDGYRWQTLTCSLTTFNFKFEVESNLPSIDSFRTSFWSIEKCWYVDCQNRSVFSVPYFSPVHVDIPARSHEFLKARFSSMNIIGIPKNQMRRYPHIKNLSINCSITLEKIVSLVNLKQITHLSLPSIADLSMFQPLESIIPHLYELKIENAVTLDAIERIKGDQFNQIRILSISISNTDVHLILKELFHYFPHIESLIYLSAIDSAERLANVIDGFRYLSHVTFDFDRSFVMRSMGVCEHPSFFIRHSRRLSENNFTFRFRPTSSFRFGNFWWIASQVSVDSAPKICIFSRYIVVSIICS